MLSVSNDKVNGFTVVAVADAVLKALGSLESTEEKLAALCKKYADLLEENRLLQQKFKQSQKSLSVVSRSSSRARRACLW